MIGLGAVFVVGEAVAEAGHVHAHQLELGGHVRALEGALLAEQVGGGDLGHLVAGRHQAVNHAAVKGDFADGVDVGVGGAQLVVHDDAAALADRQPAGAGQVVARLDAGRDDDHLHVQLAAVDEGHALDLAVAEDLLGVLVEVDLDAERVDLADEHVASRRRRSAAASAAGRTRRHGFPGPGRKPPWPPPGRAGRRR